MATAARPERSSPSPMPPTVAVVVTSPPTAVRVRSEKTVTTCVMVSVTDLSPIVPVTVTIRVILDVTPLTMVFSLTCVVVSEVIYVMVAVAVVVDVL